VPWWICSGYGEANTILQEERIQGRGIAAVGTLTEFELKKGRFYEVHMEGKLIHVIRYNGDMGDHDITVLFSRLRFEKGHWYPHTLEEFTFKEIPKDNLLTYIGSMEASGLGVEFLKCLK
jgi:hypothetical protein